MCQKLVRKQMLVPLGIVVALFTVTTAPAARAQVFCGTGPGVPTLSEGGVLGLVLAILVGAVLLGRRSWKTKAGLVGIVVLIAVALVGQLVPGSTWRPAAAGEIERPWEVELHRVVASGDASAVQATLRELQQIPEVSQLLNQFSASVRADAITGGSWSEVATVLRDIRTRVERVATPPLPTEDSAIQIRAALAQESVVRWSAAWVRALSDPSLLKAVFTETLRPDQVELIQSATPLDSPCVDEGWSSRKILTAFAVGFGAVGWLGTKVAPAVAVVGGPPAGAVTFVVGSMFEGLGIVLAGVAALTSDPTPIRN